MQCLGFQQVAITDTAKTVSAFTIPTGATHVLIQADQQNARFTLNGTTTATAGTTGVGEVLVSGYAPRQIDVGDFRNISIIRAAGSNGVVNVHYYGGRGV